MTQQLTGKRGGAGGGLPGLTATPLTVTPITGTIGAEVTGVDASSPLDPEVVGLLRQALLRHLVLFFRHQELTDEQHLEFARTFGTPNVWPGTRARGLDVPIEWIEDHADSPPKSDIWHTDAAFLPQPPDIGVLSMIDSPEVGGDTMWLNLYAVYDALSEPMKRIADGLDLDLHPGENMKAKLDLQFGPGVFERVADEFAGATHPLVRVHPESGRRALFLCGAYMRGIAGMSPEESRVVLDLFRTGLDNPSTQCRWRWQVNDLAVWDERCTNHRGLGDHYPNHRLVRRCTVGAGSPQGVDR